MICLHLFCNSECQSVEWVRAPCMRCGTQQFTYKKFVSICYLIYLINKTAKNSTIDVMYHFHSFVFCPSIAIFIIFTHYRCVRLSQPSNRQRCDNKKTILKSSSNALECNAASMDESRPQCTNYPNLPNFNDEADALNAQWLQTDKVRPRSMTLPIINSRSK